MNTIHLIVVGKYRDAHLEALESDFIKRLVAPKLQIHELKDYAEDVDREALDIEKKIDSLCPHGAHIVLLAEKGKLMDSHAFASYLKELVERPKPLVFVIGGAAGHGSIMQKKTNALLSLSPMTYPHKLARLLFIEQLYRAQTIWKGHPYHK